MPAKKAASKPRTLRRSVAFSGRLFSVSTLTVRLPDGAEVDREIVEHRGAVAVLPFVDPDTVALVRQYRPAVDEYLLEVPAGVLDEGEPAAVCAERELREEIGLRPRKLHPIGTVFPTPGFVSEALHLFIAWDFEADPAAPDDDEHLEVEHLPFDDLRDRVKAGKIRDGKTMSLVSYAVAFPPAALVKWRRTAGNARA